MNLHEVPWMDYLIHFGLETIGGLVALYAYQFCDHTWHKLAVWITFSMATTIATVHLVG